MKKKLTKEQVLESAIKYIGKLKEQIRDSTPGYKYIQEENRVPSELDEGKINSDD